MTPLSAHESNPLTVASVENAITQEELAKISNTADRIVRDAGSSLSQESVTSLVVYWKNEAAMMRNVAETLIQSVPSDTPENSESYCSVKEALVQALIFEKAAGKLAARLPVEEDMFKRRVGETLDEYKQRISQYVNELQE